MGLLTSTSISTTAFLLGCLFTSALWDSTLLYSKEPLSDAALQAIELYYLTWWNGAVAVKTFLHFVFLADFTSLVVKFAKYTDSSYFFSGASLVLLIFTSGLYLTVTVPYIRVLALDPSIPTSIPRAELLNDTLSRMQAYFSSRNTGPLGNAVRLAAQNLIDAPPMTRPERFTHLSVLCAANTIATVFLVGVLMLQVGEWYTEEEIIRPAEAEMKRLEALKSVEGQRKKDQ